MKSVRTPHWILASLLATSAFAALAQAPAAPPAGGPGAHPPGHERMAPMDPAKRMERFKEHMAKRQADMKAKLKITTAQEGAWSAFTASMQPPAMGARPDRSEFDKLTTPQRIDRMQALRTQRAAEMDKRAAATKTFYAALTPYQQGIFDAQSAHRGGHHGKHGGGFGHGPRG